MAATVQIGAKTAVWLRLSPLFGNCPHVFKSMSAVKYHRRRAHGGGLGRSPGDSQLPSESRVGLFVSETILVKAFMIVLRLPIPRFHFLIVHCLRLAESAFRFLPEMHRYLANVKPGFHWRVFILPTTGKQSGVSQSPIHSSRKKSCKAFQGSSLRAFRTHEPADYNPDRRQARTLGRAAVIIWAAAAERRRGFAEFVRASHHPGPDKG